MGCIDSEELVKRHTFLYISRRKVAACVSVECIQEAFELLDGEGGLSSSTKNTSEDCPDYLEGDTTSSARVEPVYSKETDPRTNAAVEMQPAFPSTSHHSEARQEEKNQEMLSSTELEEVLTDQSQEAPAESTASDSLELEPRVVQEDEEVSHSQQKLVLQQAKQAEMVATSIGTQAMGPGDPCLADADVEVDVFGFNEGRALPFFLFLGAGGVNRLVCFPPECQQYQVLQHCRSPALWSLTQTQLIRSHSKRPSPAPR